MHMRFWVLLVLLCSNAVLGSTWQFKSNTDPFTDQSYMLASNRDVAVTCSVGKIDGISISFDTYLSTDQSEITFRFDANPAVSGDWNTSTTGTAVFVPKFRQVEFLRSLFQAKKLTIRSMDFRGTPHMRFINLNQAQEKSLEEFADFCGFDLKVSEALQQARGTHSTEVLRRIDAYGPRYTKCAKETLNYLGYLDVGDVNSQKDASYYQGFRTYFDSIGVFCAHKRLDNYNRWKFCAEDIRMGEEVLTMSLYRIGTLIVDDPDDYIEICGSLTQTD